MSQGLPSPSLVAVARLVLGASLLLLVAVQARATREAMAGDVAARTDRQVSVGAIALAAGLDRAAGRPDLPRALAATELSAWRVGRPVDEAWEALTDDQGSPWHVPLARTWPAPGLQDAWGVADFGGLGLAGPPERRWAYVSFGPPKSGAPMVGVGLRGNGDGDRGPWLLLLFGSLVAALATARRCALALAPEAALFERLRLAGLTAAAGREAAEVPVPPELGSLSASLRSSCARLEACLVAGPREDAALEAYRRDRELAHALGWVVAGREPDRGALFAAAWPTAGEGEGDASGCQRRGALAVAWLGLGPVEPVVAATQRAAIGRLVARLLARHGQDWAGLAEALRPLVGREARAFVWWDAASGQAAAIAAAPVPATKLLLGGRVEPVQLSPEPLRLHHGEALVFASGTDAPLELLIEELAGIVALPQDNADQLLAVIEGGAAELLADMQAQIGLVVALAADQPNAEEPA